MSTVDTVLNSEMRAVFVDDPATVVRRLKANHPESWVKVLIGETERVVGISEYLYGDKCKSVEGLIKDVVSKSKLGMYVRDPSRLDKYIERTALKIVELVKKEG